MNPISILSWKQRLQIAYNVDNAINYLHNFTTPPLVHKNLTSANILFDGNLTAKITNFVLARADHGDGEPQLTRHVVGTSGYMAPEYLENGVISSKMDIFASGVMVLELLSGKNAVLDDEEKIMLFELIENVVEGDDVRDKLYASIDPCLKDDNFPFQ